ncbi:MAG: hypothetical protein C4B59_08345 [Candidatus Methanogaster sp.]|uniref:Uncharacterized protein n=1 Tax=Candidatus Methanogaster sp. TaxID=3386292 RepID=A0AC61L2R8_9EURY|nr:MAG: hypothetical protein C4B59_08345 [ANME-2 cluster archaeon]
MNKITKASLALVVLFIVILIAIFVQSLADEKKECVTDPVIAHIPLRADLDFSFPDSDGPTSINIVYILTPTVDVKVNVSEGIVLPEGIVFVENNLPTGQITLSKGRTYKFRAKIKAVETGFWIFYVSPGVYGDVTLFEERVNVGVQGVFDATVPLTRFRLRAKVSQEGQDILLNITKNWLRGYGAVEYGQEEFSCTIISANPDIRCCGCELLSYSNSKLYDKYYFVIEEDQHTNKTKIRNVYRWAYQTPSGYQQKPVCEEITMKGGENYE